MCEHTVQQSQSGRRRPIGPPRTVSPLPTGWNLALFGRGGGEEAVSRLRESLCLCMPASSLLHQSHPRSAQDDLSSL